MMQLSGLFPPIPTPFQDGAFDAARMAANIEHWNDQPLDGYVVLGSNGEFPLLDESERASVVMSARKAVPSSRKLVVGTGRESTRATIRSTREAFDLGADAALVGVPAYYKPAMTEGVLRDHFMRVADAALGPLLLYSVPFFTALPISADLFGSLAAHERIIGIKESSGEAATLAPMLQAARSSGRSLSVLVGSARLLAAGIGMGAAGGVLAVANVAPRICAEIVRLARVPDAAAAEALNARLDPLTDAVTRRFGIGGLKAALDLLHYFGGEPRSPLPPASPEARAEIASRLRDLGLLT